jgi:spermidine/putrescine-binding protein
LTTKLWGDYTVEYYSTSIANKASWDRIRPSADSKKKKSEDKWLCDESITAFGTILQSLVYRIEHDIGDTHGLIPKAFIFPSYLLKWIQLNIDDEAFSKDGLIASFSTKYGFNFGYRHAVVPFIMGAAENHWGVKVFDFAEKVGQPNLNVP